MVRFGVCSPPGMAELLFLTASLLNALNVTAGIIAQYVLTGAGSVFVTFSNATPGNQTTRTGTQLYNDLTAQLGFAPRDGFSYDLQLLNTGAGTLTLVAGTGVTLSGTMTVPVNTTRQFVVTVTGPNLFTITAVGTGTFS